MNSKNKIILFLKQYRKAIAMQFLLKNTLVIITILSSISIISIGLERFNYFSSDIRLRILIFMGFLFLCLLLYAITLFILQKNGNIIELTDEKISKKIGKENNEISDQLTNAYQLSKTHSKNKIYNDFINHAISLASNKINDVTYPQIFDIIRTKITAIAMMLILCLVGLLLNKKFNNAAVRLVSPNITYEIPTPFSIVNQSSDQTILEGDSLNVRFSILDGSFPDSIDIVIKKVDENIVIKQPYTNQGYDYTIMNVQNSFEYWAEYQSKNILDPWDVIKSNKGNVKIIKRPRISTINFTIIPPLYSGLDKKLYSSNNTDISILEGSELHINANVNKNINKAWALINNEIDTLMANFKEMQGVIRIKESSDITLMCQDEDNITNINPPLNRITILPDYKPQVFIAEPKNEFDINDSHLIDIDMQIIDDFGFSDIWIEYRIIRPEYLSQDNNIYKYKIDKLDPLIKAQKIETQWDIKSLSLAPDDKIEFFILVADNNNVTGPSISSSGPFIGKIPSLEDLFNTINEMEEEIFESTEEIVLTIDEVKELVDDLEKDMLKSDEVDWEQSQKINESSQKIDDIIDEIESIKEVLQDIQEQSEENELFNQELMQKFNEFQELLDSIMTPEMMETLNKIKEMMNNMDTGQMLDSIQDLKQDISMLDDQLDRFIELFEMVMSEQAFDEMIRILEELIIEQMNISNKLLNQNETMSALEAIEQNQIKAFNGLQILVGDNIPLIKKFSSEAAKNLEELLDSELVIVTNLHLEGTLLNIKSEKVKESLQSSELSITSLEDILEIIEQIKDKFNSESVNEMTAEFITLLKNVDSISFDQEIIISSTKKIRSNSPKLRGIAFQQNIIQNKIIKVIDQIMELSNKTFHVPPTINKSIGQAQLAIQKSISSIEQKKIHTARKEQKKALNSINETAYLLIVSLENMQSSMSASGMESYLEQLEKMAGQQQQINQGTGQCMMPGGGMPGQLDMQQELMKRLQAQQEALQEQLGEMMGEMPGQGGQNGGLSKALEDMEDVINDFKRKKINRETIDRQEKILSRMIDSQKSIRQKDYSDKRKSTKAEQFEFEGPISLPDNYGERQTILTNALEDALQHGYSNDYQIILKKYFKNLENDE